MTQAATGGGYPVELDFPESNQVANWRPLAHWLMVIPHALIAYVINALSGIITFVAWFIILFTGELPAGMANFMVMNQRYQVRVYGYYLGLTEDYPPFTYDVVADDPGDYSIQLSVQPDLEGRNRLTVFFRLFMLIPLAIVGYVFVIIAGFLAFLAWFAVLFTGAYPSGMRNFVIGTFRFWTRLGVYGSLLTDEYPPFNMDR